MGGPDWLRRIGRMRFVLVDRGRMRSKEAILWVGCVFDVAHQNGVAIDGWGDLLVTPHRAYAVKESDFVGDGVRIDGWGAWRLRCIGSVRFALVNRG